MTSKPRNAAKRGGRRVSKAEVRRRTVFCEELLVTGATRARVVEVMCREFGMKPRTADDYRARAYQRWGEVEHERRAVRRAETIRRMDRAAAIMEANGAWSAWASIEYRRAQVLGAMEHEPETEELRQVSEQTSLEDAELQVAAALQAFADHRHRNGRHIADSPIGEVIRSLPRREPDFEHADGRKRSKDTDAGEKP